MRARLASVVCLVAGVLVTSGADSHPIVQMLVPGFTVQELPVRLSNINNLRFAPDGRLTALGYDGRIHLLRDTDQDGLEDQVEVFWNRPTLSVPVGMAWSKSGLYVSSHGKVSLLRDTNGDGIADVEEVIASGWPPTDVASGGVDATALTLDQEGNLYFGLLVADYANAYRIKDGKSYYDIHSPRGTIQKWSPKTLQLETIATGIRVPYALAFNQRGDLFLTDQEGETWMPHGNPLDELNHILPGRNYGFPPRHEKWLPRLISEPPIVSFGPQHQSTCGFVFNEPEPRSDRWPGRGLFGPNWWKGDAFVAGESRGKIWRVRLVKTPWGYVGKEFLIARLSMLTTDVAISPRGELYVSCHSGPPDWGTGPQGEGKLFKIAYADPKVPQPIMAWPANMKEARVAFDRPLDPSVTNRTQGMKLEAGEFVSAADRFEVLKPPYEVVKRQEAAPRREIGIQSARLVEGNRVLALDTDASLHNELIYALTLPGIRRAGAKSATATVDVQFDVSGAEIVYLAPSGLRRIPRVGEKTHALARRAGFQTPPGTVLYDGWAPTPDIAAARELARPYEPISRAFELLARGSGERLSIRFLMPAQAVTLHGRAKGPFTLLCLDATDGASHGNRAVQQTDGTYAASLRLSDYKPSGDSGRFYEVEVTGSHELGSLKPSLVSLAYSTPEDATLRPLSMRHTQLPGAHAVRPAQLALAPAGLSGGDWQRGKDLFFGEQLKSGTCHRLREEGAVIGPDLSTAVELRDLERDS